MIMTQQHQIRSIFNRHLAVPASSCGRKWLPLWAQRKQDKAPTTQAINPDENEQQVILCSGM